MLTIDAALSAKTDVAQTTTAIQAAIDQAAKAGETLFFPAGEYVVTSLLLRSGSDLKLDAGAKLTASPIYTDWKDCSLQPLLLAQNVQNIRICGGTLCDSGYAYHDMVGKRLASYRPHGVLRFSDSSGIFLQDVIITDSVAWTFHLNNCEDVKIDRVTIRNPEYLISQNTDGIDLNSCRNVEITGCDIETGDDAICLKSFDPKDPSNTRRDMFHIRVSDCVLATTCNATKIGTETVGDIYDVSFRNITVKRHPGASVHGYPDEGGYPISAVNVESNDGAFVHDITFENYIVHQVNTPIFILLQNRKTLDSNAKMGKIENITVRNVQVKEARRASQINVQDGAMVENVLLEEIKVRNLETYPAINGPVIPCGRCYPDPYNYGHLPAHGLYARNVKGLTIANTVEFLDGAQSGRPPIVTEHTDCD